jgi:hypothetical protein
VLWFFLKKNYYLRFHNKKNYCGPLLGFVTGDVKMEIGLIMLILEKLEMFLEMVTILTLY